MAAMSIIISSISSFKCNNISPQKRIAISHSLLHCKKRSTISARMSVSSNVNAPVLEKDIEGFGLKRGFQSMNNVDEMINAIDETEKDSGLKYWILAHKLQKQGGDPHKVIEYCKKANTMLEDYKERGVHAPDEIVHGWSFAIASVNRIMGCAYYDLKDYDYNSSIPLTKSEKILKVLPQDECVMQSLLDTQFERFKLDIMNKEEDEYNMAYYHMSGILETKEKIMGGECTEIGDANKDVCIVYLSFFNFKGALPYALKALEIYAEHLGDSSVAVAQVRGIIGLIYSQLGKCKKARKQNKLSQGILTKTTQTTCDFLKGNIDRSDRLIEMERYQEAIQVLELVVSQLELKGGERTMALVSMARALCYQKKFADAKKYMETACKILDKEEMPTTYIIVGFWVMSGLYGKMNEYENAVSLLRRLLLVPKLPMKLFVEGSKTLCSLMFDSGGYEKKEIFCLKDCVERLKSTLDPVIYEAGYGFGSLAVDYMKLGRTESAVKFMKYAKQGNDVSLAPYYEDLLQATQNLSVAYATIGSYDLAIALQSKAVESLAVDRTEPSITKKLDIAARLLNQFKEMAGDSQ